MNIGADKFVKMTYLVLEIDEPFIKKHCKFKFLALFKSLKDRDQLVTDGYFSFS